MPIEKYREIQGRLANRVKRYGNKAANLLELISLARHPTLQKLKIAIPPVHPLSHDFIQQHLDRHAREWRDLWAKFITAQGSEKTSLTKEAIAVLEDLQALIERTFSQHPIVPEEKLSSFLEEINQNENSLLMVRSTGEEDSLDETNPGGNESVSAVIPRASEISRAIGSVVASYFSEKSLKQRMLSATQDAIQVLSKDPFMPVLLQQMIGEPKQNHLGDEAIVRSGVMFTGEAAIGIQVAPGHGELVVNNKAPADTFMVTRENIVYPQVYLKKSRLAAAAAEEKGADSGEKNKRLPLIFVKNSKNLQENPTIDRLVALRLAEAGRAIEEHYGIPMDVEFVYHPSTDIIYLVQARPIATNDLRAVLPSSIPPQKMVELKAEIAAGAIERTEASVIVAAGNAASVITQKEEALLDSTLDLALAAYLREKDSPVKVVFAEAEAQENSHSAQQFKQMGIPSFQTENREKLEAWLKNDNLILVVDPQRNQVLNFSHSEVPREKVEEALYTQGYLEKGLFTLALSPLTLLPYNSEGNEPQVQAIATAFTNLQQALVNKDKIYTQLLASLETLEEAKPDSANPSAKQALEQIASIFKKIGSSLRSEQKDSPHRLLMLYAATTLWEISAYLYPYGQAAPENVAFRREELLNLISKLRSIVAYPGKPSVYSQSIKQLAQENKALGTAALEGIEQLNPSQLTYFSQLMKLKKIIFNPEGQEKWANFVLHCCQDEFSTQALAHMAKFCLEYGVESYWLNTLFLDHYRSAYAQAKKLQTAKQTALLAKSILLSMKNELEKTALELNKMKFYEINETIQRWESRIADWGEPKNFAALLKDYQKELLPLIHQLMMDHDATPLAKKTVVQAVHTLSELMDKTIKALKSSLPQYPREQQGQLVQRFAQLLEPFHALMVIWMSAIPSAQYLEWQDMVNKVNKRQMLNYIKESFSQLSKSTDIKQLNSSLVFSVSSARAGSAANFGREFVNKKKDLTLEDLFSLMHQNINFCASFLIKDLQPKVEQLPRELQLFMQELGKRHRNFVPELVNIEHHYPLITVEYNCALANHAAKFTIVFDQRSHLLSLQGEVFGHNNYGRMDKIAEITSFEEGLFNAKVKCPAHHDAIKKELRFVWEFDAAQMKRLPSLLAGSLREYTAATFVGAGGLDHNLDFYRTLNRHLSQNSDLLSIGACLQKLFIAENSPIPKTILALALLSLTAEDSFPISLEEAKLYCDPSDLSRSSFTTATSIKKLILHYGFSKGHL